VERVRAEIKKKSSPENSSTEGNLNSAVEEARAPDDSWLLDKDALRSRLAPLSGGKP